MLQFEKHIMQYLENSGVGTIAAATGWGIFESQIPTTPNTCIVVTENGGKPILTLGEIQGNFFQFNIIIRGNAGITGQTAALVKANEIYDLLKFNLMITVGSDVYHNIRAISNVMDGGQDKNNRPMFAMNFMGLYSN
jgi:hypothetical protein